MERIDWDPIAKRPRYSDRLCRVYFDPRSRSKESDGQILASGEELARSPAYQWSSWKEPCFNGSAWRNRSVNSRQLALANVSACELIMTRTYDIA